MKLLKAPLSTIILLTISIIFTSCFENKRKMCEDDLPKPKKFSIQSLAIKTASLPDSIPFDTASFYEYNNVLKVVYPNQKQLISDSKEFNFFLFNNAYACSPVVYDTFSVQNIVDIQIISQTDTLISKDVRISKGQNINSLFEGSHSDYPSYNAIEYYSNYKNRFTFSDELRLRIKEHALSIDSLTLTFNIRIQLSDGIVYYFANERLKIR